jgi:hypothetical protein
VSSAAAVVKARQFDACDADSKPCRSRDETGRDVARKVNLDEEDLVQIFGAVE